MHSLEDQRRELQELRARLDQLEAAIEAAMEEGGKPLDDASPGPVAGESLPPPLSPAAPDPSDHLRFAPPELREPAPSNPQLDSPPPPIPEEPPPPPLPPISILPSSPAPPPVPPASLATSESWLARVGVTIFVVGILLFLKLALDQGWISATIQLGLIAFLASGFCLAGWKLEKSRPPLAALFFGIGVVGLYGTILAGRVLHGILPSWLACVLTLLVALLGVIQSLRRGISSLAFVGLLGGYGALLYLGNPALDVGLHVFLGSVFFTTAMLLYALRGWPFIYLAGIVLQALLLGWLSANFLEGRGFLLAGLSWFAFVAWWASLKTASATHTARQKESFTALAFLGAAFPAGFAVTLAAWVWTGRLGGDSMRDWQSWGYLAMALALSACGLWLWRNNRPRVLQAAQFIAGQGFLTLALLCWLGGNVLVGALTLQMLSLHRLSSLRSLPGIRLAAHLLAALVFGFLVAMSAQLATDLRPALPSTGWTLLFVVLSFLVAGRWCKQNTSLDLSTPMASGKSSAKSIGKPAYDLLAFLSGVIFLWGWATAYPWNPASSSLVLALWAGGFFRLRPPESTQTLRASSTLYLAGLGFALFLALNASVYPPSGLPFANLQAWKILAALALVFLAVQGATYRAAILRWASYAIFLVLLAGQLGSWHQGLWVSPAWAVCAIVLIAWGVRRSLPAFRRGGMATLLLLLVRLFLIDLATLDPVWRALIFLGIGGALLLAAYYLPRWARSRKPPAPPAL